ncbi:MAG: protease complex subunit PrcB family protein [Abditibacteriales bacterium]|nr:protease complex subunit PrcB family protein [Abditibacteriales bacterium]MDW8366136.1 protease complex subunit PrcB family protein [Abditibacteriales bacterium]
MNYLWLITACVILFLFGGSQAAEGGATNRSDVKFDTIAKGTHSGVRRAEMKVITTDKEWEQFWKQHTSVTSPPLALPKVDFEKQVVVVVTAGEKMTGGYTIEVTRVEVKKDAVMVYYKETKPKSTNFTIQVLTQPYHFIRLDKPKLPVKFVAE